MPYCTEAEVRAMTVEFENTTTWTTTNVNNAISLADSQVEMDLSPLFSIIQLQALASVPVAVKALSKYMTAVFLLTAKHSINDQVNRKIDFWQKRYDTLLEKIITGKVKILTTAGAVALNTRNGFGGTFDETDFDETPKFGDGDYFDSDSTAGNTNV